MSLAFATQVGRASAAHGLSCLFRRWRKATLSSLTVAGIVAERPTYFIAVSPPRPSRCTDGVRQTRRLRHAAPLAVISSPGRGSSPLLSPQGEDGACRPGDRGHRRAVRLVGPALLPLAGQAVPPPGPRE